MGIAAQTMRRILLDHAKHKAAAKRGGGEVAIELDESSIGGKVCDVNLIALVQRRARSGQFLDVLILGASDM
jgi:hypothetical protein